MNKIFSQLTKAGLLVVFYILFISTISFAQAPGGGGPIPQDPEDEETPPPTGVPIDGGASLLLLAGAGYGLKKLRDNYKGKKEQE